MVEYLSGGRIQGKTIGAVDSLGTAVNGTNSGTVTDNNTPFYGDTTVAFDNNDAVHDLGTTSSFAGLIKEDFTVIFWAKASAVGDGGAGSDNGWGSGSSSNTYAGNQGTILNCGQVSGNGSTQGFVISFDDGGSEEFFMWMGDGNGNCIINDVIGSNNVADTDNNWHLYMFHFDNTNSQVRIYRDGGSSAIQTTSYASQVSSTSATTYKKMFMGRQADDDGRYFIGSLADVSIWKRLVTTSEFNTLWGTFQDNTSTATNSVKGVRVDALSDQSGLLAHWKLDDLNFTNSASSTDEKDSLTNVPANTRYEETDTRKIYRSSVIEPKFLYKFDESSGDVINHGSVGTSANLTVTGLTRDVSSPSGIGDGMSGAGIGGGDYATTTEVNAYKFLHDGSSWSITYWSQMTELPTSSTTETFIFGNVWTDDQGTGLMVRTSYVSASSGAMLNVIAAANNNNIPLNVTTDNLFIPDTTDWHFYALTFDGTTLTMQRDNATTGAGYKTGDKSAHAFNTGNPTRKPTWFNRDVSQSDKAYGGKIAQFTIWDRVLTAAEKTSLYASGNGTTTLPSPLEWKERNTA